MGPGTLPHIREWDVLVTYRLNFSCFYFPFLCNASKFENMHGNILTNLIWPLINQWIPVINYKTTDKYRVFVFDWHFAIIVV